MCYNVILKPELPATIYYQHPVNSSIEDGTDFLLYFDKEDAFLVAGLLCFVYCAGDGRVSSSSIASLSRSTIGQLFKMCFVVQLWVQPTRGRWSLLFPSPLKVAVDLPFHGFHC